MTSCITRIWGVSHSEFDVALDGDENLSAESSNDVDFLYIEGKFLSMYWYD